MEGLKVVALVLGILTAGLLFAVYNAWVLSILWAWFVVPLGVKAIGIAHAYGITQLVSLFLSNRGLKENKSKEDWVSTITIWITIPAIALFFGWIAVGFM